MGNSPIGLSLCAEDYLNDNIPFKTRIVAPDLWPPLPRPLTREPGGGASIPSCTKPPRLTTGSKAKPTSPRCSNEEACFLNDMYIWLNVVPLFFGHTVHYRLCGWLLQKPHHLLHAAIERKKKKTVLGDHIASLLLLLNTFGHSNKKKKGFVCTVSQRQPSLESKDCTFIIFSSDFVLKKNGN